MVVKKGTGKLRPCTDLRSLNDATEPVLYPLPRIDVLKTSIRGHVFSSIDLQDAYFHIPIRKGDECKTAVETPLGVLEFMYMPFGYKNAPAFFQRFIDGIFQNVPFLVTYLDDILVLSSSIKEHHEHLKFVFNTLDHWSLRANTKKCKFFQSSVNFLGITFTPLGYRPMEDHIPPVMDMAPPKTAKGVLKFLGMIGYYRSHIPDFARIAAPLYSLCLVLDAPTGIRDFKRTFRRTNRFIPSGPTGEFSAVYRC